MPHRRNSHPALALVLGAVAALASAGDPEGRAGGPRNAVSAELVSVELRLEGEAVPTITVTRGSRLRLALRTPVPQELHLHGYDLTARAGPVEPARFVFDAIHTGRFEISAHGGEDLLGRHERPLAYLEVRPE